MMKGRRLQACRLRHSIKKGMLSVWSKLDLFKSGRGGVLAPRPPFPWLRASLMGLKPFVMPLKTLLVI